MYSQAICTLTPSLCSHTTPPPQPWTGSDSPLPQSRLNIVRHFAFQSHAVSFTVSTIDDVFELCVPRLQITPGAAVKSSKDNDGAAIPDEKEYDGGEEKRVLRREIKSWWQCVADHLDELVSSCRA